MTETMSRAELIAAFGAGWRLETLNDPPDLEEILVRRESRPDEDDDVVDNVRIFATPEAAIAGHRRWLQTRLDTILADYATAESANILQHLARRLFPFGDRRRRRLLERADQRIATIRDRIALLERNGLSRNDLPATIEHYGRLAVDTPIWVFDSDHPEAGLPIFRCRVLAERAPSVNRALSTGGPVSFQYQIRSETKRPRWDKELCLTLGPSGPELATYYGLSAYLSFDQAIAARKAFLDSFMARIERGAPRTADEPAPPIEMETMSDHPEPG